MLFADLVLSFIINIASNTVSSILGERLSSHRGLNPHQRSLADSAVEDLRYGLARARVQLYVPLTSGRALADMCLELSKSGVLNALHLYVDNGHHICILAGDAIYRRNGDIILATIKPAGFYDRNPQIFDINKYLEPTEVLDLFEELLLNSRYLRKPCLPYGCALSEMSCLVEDTIENGIPIGRA